MPVHHAAETNSTLAEALPSRAARDGAHSTTGPCRRSTRARSSAYSSSLHRSLAEVLTPPASRPLRTRLLHAKNRRAQAEPRPAGNREARQPSRLSAALTTELHGATSACHQLRRARTGIQSGGTQAVKLWLPIPIPQRTELGRRSPTQPAQKTPLLCKPLGLEPLPPGQVPQRVPNGTLSSRLAQRLGCKTPSPP
ncbi:hypothetical protein ACCO45_012937 [Purpureocillium lilacinum]|uniref:Uncharacterized protein n=1 Tax=Purpureocillium lilacinum TaxID=33203 RepID=A0ACC4DBM0_PURLI